MMEAVEQDWRQQYEACYPQPGGFNMRMAAHVPMEQGAVMPATVPYMNPGYALGHVPMPEREDSGRIADSKARLIAGEPRTGVLRTGSKTRLLLLRSVVLFVVGLVGVAILIFVALAFSGSLYGSSGDDAGAPGNEAAPGEPTLKLDAPRPPVPPPPMARAKAQARRKHRVSPHKVGKHGHHKELKTKPRIMKHALADGKEEANPTPPVAKEDPQCGEPKQAFCEETKLAYFYRKERKFCDSSYQDPVYVCNHSPNRFGSLKACTSACIKNNKPLPKCQKQPIFTECNRNDLKRSYWYRKNDACVEWNYPDGYCASKLRGVARSIQECRDKCLGPGTDDRSCTLPAELTCRTKDMKFPYFAYTFPNGTVECLLADQDLLRPHKCMVGENTYPTRDECKRACSGAVVFRSPNI